MSELTSLNESHWENNPWQDVYRCTKLEGSIRQNGQIRPWGWHY